MRDTGIVRRVDELGRVVIPKEIRKTLRIREGDPIEIFTDREQLIFKKYSPVSSILETAEIVAENLSKLTEKSVAVCDNDCILYVSGSKKDLVNKNISTELEGVLKERKSVMLSKTDGAVNIPLINDDKSISDNQIIVPIVNAGDCYGAVVLFENGSENPFTASDVKLVQLSAMMLSSE